jgi:RNA polymerase sigma-70 factor (sigma-E family)
VAADAGEFEALVRGQGAGLLKTAVLLTGDRREGEDLLQDALEACFRGWPAQGVTFPAAYVRTAMVRLHRRRRLAARLRPLLHLGLGAGTDAGERDDLAGRAGRTTPAVDEVGAREDRQVLLAALRRVPARQRAVVVLRYWEDLSEAETAATLGCSVGTVKSQAARGLAKLRDHLDWPVEPGPAPRPTTRPRQEAPRRPATPGHRNGAAEVAIAAQAAVTDGGLR